MDIWTYKMQKEREFEENSVEPDPPIDEIIQAAPDSPDGKRGRVLGYLVFPEQDAYMRVFERVVVRGNSVHRDRYSYALIIDGVHEYGWERDPSHDPAVHEHEGSGRTRKASEPCPLKRALKIAWERLSERAEMPSDDLERDR